MRELNNREKKLLYFLTITIIITLLYYLIILPLINYLQNADSESLDQQEKFTKLNSIYLKYKETKTKKDNYQRLLSGNSISVTSIVQNWAEANNAKNNLNYTNINESNIQNKFVKITTNVKFNGIPVQKLMKFLEHIENSRQLITVSYLKINRALKGTKTYDALIKIDNYKLKK